MTNAEIRQKIMVGAKAEIAGWIEFSKEAGWHFGMSRSDKGSYGLCVNDAKNNTSRYLLREWLGDLTDAERKAVQREVEKMERDGLIVRIRESGRTSHIKLLKVETKEA